MFFIDRQLTWKFWDFDLYENYLISRTSSMENSDWGWNYDSSENYC